LFYVFECGAPVYAAYENEEDYDKIQPGDELVLTDARSKVLGPDTFEMENRTKGYRFGVILDVSGRLKQILAAGGLLNFTREKNE
jgi:aconitate hydratase